MTAGFSLLTIGEVPEEHVPVVLSIDVEPDDFVFPLEEPCPWRGFELLVAELGPLRRKLQDISGVPARFSWFVRMDPQIALGYGSPTWAATELSPLFEELQSKGDSIGIHPHAWRWDDDRRVWISDHADQGWADRCLEVSVQAYRESFGQTPPAMRYGSRFMSTATMNLARDLGIRFDLSVEPGEPSIGPGEHPGQGLWTGETPDFAGAPRVPYRPHPSDFLRPADGGANGLWAIPMSAGRIVLRDPALRREWARLRRALPKTWDRLRHPARTAGGLARRLGGQAPRSSPTRNVPAARSHRSLRLYWDWRSPADFWDSAFEAAGESERPYLAFAIRSDIPLRRDKRRRMDAIFRHLLTDPRARQLVFTTPEDALARMGLAAGQAPSG